MNEKRYQVEVWTRPRHSCIESLPLFRNVAVAFANIFLSDECWYHYTLNQGCSHTEAVKTAAAEKKIKEPGQIRQIQITEL